MFFQKFKTVVYLWQFWLLPLVVVLFIISNPKNILAVQHNKVLEDDILPRPLNLNDAKLYQEIFSLQEVGKIKEAEQLVNKLTNKMLLGHVQSQKYLHPNAWRSSFNELRIWLLNYSDHPNASRISWLAKKRKPKSVKHPVEPKKGYLNGVGQNTPQRWRASVPESHKGRISPRQTASL